MTQEEKKLVEKIYGKNFKEQDIPAYIRKRDGENLRKIFEAHGVAIKTLLGNKGSYCTKCGEFFKNWDEPSICGGCI